MSTGAAKAAATTGGEAIPLFSPHALLCQVVDVFHAAAGRTRR